VTVRPGFLARVRFDLERRPDALVVPAAAVGAGSAGAYAMVVQTDTLIRRTIETGVTLGGQVEILRGLSAGELVVTSGLVNLRAGMAVRIAAGGSGIADSAAAQEVTP
jgi:membrane fusion protein (multidrug efflux system)